MTKNLGMLDSLECYFLALDIVEETLDNTD